MTAKEIEYAVASYYGIRQNIIVPNVSWGFNIHECDLLIIRKTGYVVEVEIKISLADVKNDLKKEHKHIDKHNRIRELYFAMPHDLVEKAKEYVPQRAGILSCKSEGSVWLERKSYTDWSARKLFLEERLEIARLGSLRYWRLREKEIQNN